MPEVQNLFSESQDAARYEMFRPHYHDLPCSLLTQFFAKKIPRILDVGCGTGHSTRSLAKIADRVVGTDLSDGMLTEARKHSQHQFVQAPAEELPFEIASFDYVHVSMAFHWFDQGRFIAEANRVLKPTGFLGIDNYGFKGQMVGHSDFLEHYKSFDREQMPAAERNKNYPEKETMTVAGFQWVQDFRYEHQVEMDCAQFINYLMTRSNFLNLKPEGKMAVLSKLEPHYSAKFEARKKPMLFGGVLHLYRKITSD